MRTVYRFEIPAEEEFTVTLPLGSRILHVERQQRAPHAPCMWVLLDDSRQHIVHTFVQCGTGTPAPPPGSAEHVGTYQTFDGYVFHLFEVVR